MLVLKIIMNFFIVKMYKTYHKNIPNYNIQRQRCFYIETGWTQKKGCSNYIDYSESNLFKSKNSSGYRVCKDKETLP